MQGKAKRRLLRIKHRTGSCENLTNTRRTRLRYICIVNTMTVDPIPSTRAICMFYFRRHFAFCLGSVKILCYAPGPLLLAAVLRGSRYEEDFIQSYYAFTKLSPILGRFLFLLLSCACVKIFGKKHLNLASSSCTPSDCL
jgi:hypothetical protein